MIAWVYQNDGPGREAQKIYAALQIEFRDETARLNGPPIWTCVWDSIYIAFGGHFGQAAAGRIPLRTNHRQRLRTALMAKDSIR